MRQNVCDLNSSKILVLGLGVSGVAAAELAMSYGADVVVLDEAVSPLHEERAERLRHYGAEICLGWTGARWEHPVDLCVLSPGIAPDSRLGHLASDLACPTVSELEFGFRFCSCPILAVTGTNGKTTTVELLVHCLRQGGRSVLAAGNVGRPLSEAARKSAALDYLVVEASSFQLEHVARFAPLAAVILNITPDHLTRYRDFEHYRNSKLQILRNIRQARRIVLRQDLCTDQDVRRMLPDDSTEPVVFASSPASNASFHLTADGTLIWQSPTGRRELLHRSKLKLIGMHNVENVLAAAGLLHAAGLCPEQFIAHAARFVPAPHRLELVAVHNGIRFINDSKATNIDALMCGLRTTASDTGRNVLLIAGGLDKGMDFSPVLPLLKEQVKEAFLIGSCRERLAKMWNGVVSCQMFASLGSALDAAIDTAVSGDTVLLCPGCASQDLYENYEQRGQDFSLHVKRRIGE